jgi:NAD(P)-dependent dehydrogenase (short-subunit alcohol dehydrogenase family)
MSCHKRTLIIGAGSTIARALLEAVLADTATDQVICVSRAVDADLADRQGDRLLWLRSDYSEESIAQVVSQLAPFKSSFSRVFICNGVLHSETAKPEKRLENLTSDSLHEIFHVNAVLPMLWVKHLGTLLNGARLCRVAVFSARIGSITDNRRGGWYSYRASKAALNMLLKTASIEYARRARNVRFLVFHPGTTDTPLSRPFQGSVPKGKLFTPRFVADRLMAQVDQAVDASEIVFIDWDGKPIAW